MPRPIRFVPPNLPVECTSRTVQRRLLLTPSPETNDIVLGILGRALHKPEFKEIRLHGFMVFTNHLELILTPPNAAVLARFMCFVVSNIARRVGRFRGWSTKFWGRRYKPIVILDDDALVGRMRYLLAHGCKEGFVERPRSWPGATCLPALVSGERLTGTWYDWTALSKARRRGKHVDRADYAVEYNVPITPLPCLAGLSVEAQRGFYRRMVAEIEQETRAKNREEGRLPKGPAWVCRQDPTSIPEAKADTPAPLCHSRDQDARKAFLAAYREFVSLYRRAASCLKAGLQEVVFPSNCFPPGLPFVPPP